MHTRNSVDEEKHFKACVNKPKRVHVVMIIGRKICFNIYHAFAFHLFTCSVFIVEFIETKVDCKIPTEKKCRACIRIQRNGNARWN